MTEPQDFSDELIFPDETDGAGDAAHEIPTGTQTVVTALDESGWRLDKFLVYHFPDFSRVMMRSTTLYQTVVRWAVTCTDSI